MNRIIILLKKYYHIFFFLFLSSWIFLYQRDGLLSLGDFTFPVEPWISLYSRLFAWKEFLLLGYPSTIDFINVIHYLPIFLLHKAGLPINLVQSFFFIFLFFTVSYSTYLLLREILGNFRYKKIIAIIAANFYIFNPYIFAIKLQGYVMSLYMYAFAPLIFYLFLRYLKTKNYFKNRYLCSLGICFLLASPSTPPLYTTWVIFILFSYILLLFLLGKFNKNILGKMSAVILIFLLINLFWLVPSLGSGKFVGTLSQVKSVTNLDTLFSTSGQSLVEVFRFLGMNGFTSTWRGVPYFSYHNIYYTSIFIIVSFILLITALSFCLFRKKCKQDKFWEKYFSVIYLAAIFFIGGTVFLFPGFKRWLFENFSVLLTYRKPYEKVGFFLVFSFVGLLAFSLKRITLWLEERFGKCKRKVTMGFLVIVLILINIYSFPFWTKQVFTSFTFPECRVSGVNHYPDYYSKLGEYFQKDKLVGQVLGLPVNRSPVSSGVENYKWGYAGSDPIFGFVNTGYILINPLVPFFRDFYKSINSDLSNPVDYKSSLVGFSKLIGVKKIILRNDICWQLYGSPNPEQDKKYLENNFAKTASLGELDIYRAPDFSPLFYASRNIVASSQAPSTLPRITSSPVYRDRSVVYFEEQNQDIPGETLDIIKRYNLVKVVVPEAKMDMIEKQDNEIEKMDRNIVGLQKKRSNGLSREDELQLEELSRKKQELEEERKRLREKSAQHFAKVEDPGSYNLSFQMSSCQIERSLTYNNVPSVIINDVDYNIPYKVVEVKEEGKNVKKYKIETGNNCYVDIKGIKLDRGEVEVATNYILDLDNLVFSKDSRREIKTPILEFEKINPGKYRIRVHQATNSFPLVFSQNFHSGWKIYLMKNQKPKLEPQNLDDYKILDGNENDQADRESLVGYINQGWISNLGDGRVKKIKHRKFEDGEEKIDYVEKYKIDFVSKNFQGTIQNNNLSQGHIWDTWLKESLAEKNHFIVNGYANSWWIDLDQVKGSASAKAMVGKQESKIKSYTENSDGSIDFELIIEFWPQRLFYLGLLVSGMTLLGCIGYLGYNYIYKRKKHQ